MHPCFASLDGEPSFRLDGPLTLVGRSRACEICLDSPLVSRRHCCLALGKGEVIVRDLGSTSGTWINGRRVEVARLRHGDVLGIAHLRFRLILEHQTEGRDPAETHWDNDVAGQPSA